MLCGIIRHRKKIRLATSHFRRVYANPDATEDLDYVSSTVLFNPFDRPAGETTRVHIFGNTYMVFVWCPGGSFIMGAPEHDETSTQRERGQRIVKIENGFWISKYPVTQDQYEIVTKGQNPSEFKHLRKAFQHPVNSVTWMEAQAFCQAMSKRCIEMIRLPTEAEWEYACRAGSTGRYSFGHDPKQLHRYANYEGTRRYGNKSTSPVGRFRPNAWGIHDMHGNVCEWCDNAQEEISKDTHNPWHIAAGGATEQRVRGGCWALPAEDCRCTSRTTSNGNQRSPLIGFRVVADLLDANCAPSQRQSPFPIMRSPASTHH